MVFKNEKELKEFILKKCKSALAKTQEQVYQIIHRFVKEYYEDYTPEMYERTYQLLQSLVKSRVVSTGNGYEVQVYFDIGSLYYVTGNRPSGKEVMAAAERGLHGAIGNDFLYRFGDTGVNIWNDPMQIIDARAIDMLKNELIANGIHIK